MMIKFLFGRIIKEEVSKRVEQEIRARFECKVREINERIDRDIEKHCVELISSIFDENEPDEKAVDDWPFPGKYRKTLKARFFDEVESRVSSRMRTLEKDRVDELVSGEQFIDKIIERIKSKQLN